MDAPPLRMVHDASNPSPTMLHRLEIAAHRPRDGDTIPKPATRDVAAEKNNTREEATIGGDGFISCLGWPVGDWPVVPRLPRLDPKVKDTCASTNSSNNSIATD